MSNEVTTQADAAPAQPTQSAPALPFIMHNADKLPQLLAALAKAQGGYGPVVRDKLVVQKLKDKSTGQLTGQTIKFFYAELSSVIEATRPALAANGLSFFQPINNGIMSSILAHADGCMLIAQQGLSEQLSLKDFGIEISYLRRYLGAPMLGVASEDDSDEDGNPAGGADMGDRTPFSRDREPGAGTSSRQSPAVGPKTWPNDQFSLQFARWEKAVAAGLKTAAEICAMALSKGALTAEQEAKIGALKAETPKAEEVDDPFVHAMNAAEAAQQRGEAT